MKLNSHSYTGSLDLTEAGLIHEFNLDVQAREIWLVPNDDYVLASLDGDPLPSDPGVDYSMTTRFLKNMHILMNSDDSPILVHMKTFGGDWDQGIAIYDTIKSCPCPVVIVNYTAARSMSSLIFCAADRRIMMPHSRFMFHDGSDAFHGTTKQFLTQAQQSIEMREEMRDIYVQVMKKHSEQWANKSPAECRKWLIEQMDRKEEVYLKPAEAIKHGFADQIFDGNWNKILEF